MKASRESPYWQIQSAVPGVAWPALPAPGGAAVFALLFRLERSQWLSIDALRARQLRQLEVLLRHAHATVPYYRERWAGIWEPTKPLTQEAFDSLPLLTRRELQDKFEKIRSSSISPGVSFPEM